MYFRIRDITLEHPLGRLFECSFVVWPNTWELKKKLARLSGSETLLPKSSFNQLLASHLHTLHY